MESGRVQRAGLYRALASTLSDLRRGVRNFGDDSINPRPMSLTMRSRAARQTSILVRESLRIESCTRAAI
jgi:hypothetical protein